MPLIYINLNKTLQTESFLNFQNKEFVFNLLYFPQFWLLTASPRHENQQEERKIFLEMLISLLNIISLF